MEAMFQRTAMLIGEQGVCCLQQKHVAVFGVGGVGGAVCEALARAGIGNITLFDDDVVSESNINRQVVALRSTVGKPKVQVMAAHIANINPECKVTANRVFYLPQNAAQYPLKAFDYVVDAVDTVSAKLEIICRAKQAGVPVISAMGAGNKLHPECFKVADIAKTSICPLARVVRKELKKRGVQGVKVVYSTEMPVSATARPDAPCGENTPERPGTPKQQVPGSISFVPAAAGLVLAGQVVRDLLGVQ